MKKIEKKTSGRNDHFDNSKYFHVCCNFGVAQTFLGKHLVNVFRTYSVQGQEERKIEVSPASETGSCESGIWIPESFCPPEMASECSVTVALPRD